MKLETDNKNLESHNSLYVTHKFKKKSQEKFKKRIINHDQMVLLKKLILDIHKF